METERSFLERRAAEERLAASKAPHPRAQHAHERMARRYEQLSRERALTAQ